MGGSSKPPKPRQTNAQRNAEAFAAKRSSADLSSLRESAALRRNSRKRSPLLGGPEALSTALGVGPAMLGVNT